MSQPQGITVLIPLKQIDLAPDARRHDPAALDILIHDMKAQGQLQEIIVESKGGRYTVIAGVGRTLAARKLGWKEIRASVRTGISEFEKTRITFAENEDREDVDAFYQAALITKMIRTKNCTQTFLAKELGISKALVTAYTDIDKLPGTIKEKFRRLNSGQLTQIARLNGAKSQIRMATKCVDLDASVRQIKAWVDKKLGVAKPKRVTIKIKQAGPPDPMQDVWDKVFKSDKVSAEVYWETEYSLHTFEKGHKKMGWYFFVMPHDGEPGKAIPRWFRQMAEALESGGKRGDPPSQQRVAAPLRRASGEIPEAFRETQKADEVLSESLGTPRFPKNADEERELKAIAARGTPKDVYAWIYGADSPMTKMVPFKTWKESGMTPAEGLAKILDGIRQYEKI